MSIDPTSSLLSFEDKDKSNIKTNTDELHSTIHAIIIPSRDYFTTNYESKNVSSEKHTRKFLCVLLSLTTVFIAFLTLLFWITYSTHISIPDLDVQYTTTQSLSFTETLSDVSTDIIQIQTSDITLTTPLLNNYTTDNDTYQTTEPVKQELVKKVLFIIADGIPADVIENISLVHMKYIQEIGAYTRAYVGGDKGTYTQTPTISSPGYMSLLTGTWGNKHNIYDNYVKNPNYHYKNIFRLLKEQEPHKKIGIFSTWTTNRVKLIGEGLVEAGNITFDYKFDGYELDRLTYPRDKRARHIHDIDQRVTNETVACIRKDAPDLSWVYLEYTDDIGHFYGDSEQFTQSILSLDDQIGRIWEAIEYRMKYFQEDWLVLITTDHGRDSKDGKHHSGQSFRERTTWIMTNNQQMNRYFRDYQPAIVDLLPTIVRFLNLTIPMESERELDGIPLIGNVSLIRPLVHLNGNKLNISWTMLNNLGNVTVWFSMNNLFKKGLIDNYTMITTIPVTKQMIMIDVGKYPSQFYKIVLEGQYNSVNKWIYRPWYRNSIQEMKNSTISFNKISQTNF